MKWYKKLLHEKSVNLCSKHLCQMTDDLSVKIDRDIDRSVMISNITDKNNMYNRMSSAFLTKENAGKCSSMIENQYDHDSLPVSDRITIDCIDYQLPIELDISQQPLNPRSAGVKIILIEPDDFFDDPQEVQAYHEERKLLSDWIVIDRNELELLRYPSCQSFTSVEFFDLIEANEIDNRQLKNRQIFDNCRTSNCNEDCFDDENDDDYVQIERTPSVISLTSYDEDKHGIFYPINEAAFSIPEAYYHSSFSHDIQAGIYLVQNMILPISEEGFWSSSASLTTRRQSLPGKNKTMFKNDLSPIFKPPELSKNAKQLSIDKYFGLTDEGDLILDIDHIPEEHGFGFLMKKNKYAYRNVEFGQVIDELPSTVKSLKLFLTDILHVLRGLFKGHPRNKITVGGPGESIGAYALALASDSTSTFSRNIENFISCTKESRELAPQVVMRNMRQFMSGMKNYLVKHGEGDFQREVQRARSRLKPDEFLNLDTILEGVMHKLVVLPLREHLYGLFVDYFTRTSDIQVLVENVKYASSRSATDFGIRPTVTPPSPAALHHISVLLLRLQEAELPLEKLDLLLSVVSAIFDSTSHSRGQPLGADDFLPILVYIVAKCGFISAEIEAEFMWCLLQQSLLSGEAGYYLTALCSAVHVLKSFMASENEGTGSLDIRSSSLPASSSVLRVIIPDECNGSLQTRTLPVRPHTTTKEVCRTIAHKARITNPQDYGLFKLVNGEETLLMDSDCPQEARLEARGKHCMLAYKRIDAKIAWPTLTTT